jgi:hypothetical protein
MPGIAGEFVTPDRTIVLLARAPPYNRAARNAIVSDGVSPRGILQRLAACFVNTVRSKLKCPLFVASEVSGIG